MLNVVPLAQSGISPTTVFYWTLLFIFLTAIITTIVTKWARDKCLKFFRGYHVTLERARGVTSWGRLKVFPTGIEIVYDHPYIDPRGRRKTSFIIYQAELDSQLRTLLRYHDELTPQEQKARQRQIQRSFRPRLPRRLWRMVRNFVNTLRDAFNAAIGALVGQYQRMNPASAVASTQAGQVTQIGQTLLGKFANAYEPLLEQYIGHAVILDVLDPVDPSRPSIEYTGYLADYTQQFIAIFNVEHITERTFELQLPESDAPDAPANPARDEHGLALSVEGRRVRIANSTDQLVVARRLERDGFEAVELGMVIPPRGQLELPTRDARGGRLHLECIRSIDVLAPRKLATVRHAGDWYEPRGFLDGLGLTQFPLVPRILKRGDKPDGSP